MYESFYGFREKPFSILPDPGFLYPSRKHSMALDLLEYGLMNQAGFNVITGEIGTGKTTLVRYVLGKLDQDVTVGLISNTHRSFGELLQWILFAFRLPYRGKEKVEMFQDFVDFLVEQYSRRRPTLLIVDEAQNMSVDALEELRMLSNVNADKDLVLQIVLVGQAGLRDTLRRPEMEQFAQRIAVDYHLEPLDLQETQAYIQHRLKVAGCTNTRLFDVAACEAVYVHSRGVPRLINLLCDTALVYGFAEQKRQIDARMVEDVARDKRKGGIFPSQEKTPPASGGSEPPAPTALHAPMAPFEQEYYVGDMNPTDRAVHAETARLRSKRGK
jgi:putative secretion ATPase (PEP-CTERM system associated)